MTIPTKIDITFLPDPKVSGDTIIPPSALRVYESSVEGACISLVMREPDGLQLMQAGIRLTRDHAEFLHSALGRILGDYGYIKGWNDGMGEGSQADRLTGYETGYEDGYRACERAISDGWAEAAGL